MMSDAMTVRDVLLGAIDVLAEKGWHQGGYEGPDGVCAKGAINCAAGAPSPQSDSPLATEAADTVLRVLNLRRRALFAPWNDDPATSVEDVVLALKTAAEAAS